MISILAMLFFCGGCQSYGQLAETGLKTKGIFGEVTLFGQFLVRKFLDIDSDQRRTLSNDRHRQRLVHFRTYHAINAFDVISHLQKRFRISQQTLFVQMVDPKEVIFVIRKGNSQFDIWRGLVHGQLGNGRIAKGISSYQRNVADAILQIAHRSAWTPRATAMNAVDSDDRVAGSQHGFSQNAVGSDKGYLKAAIGIAKANSQFRRQGVFIDLDAHQGRTAVALQTSGNRRDIRGDDQSG
mmetsp:Transcript_102773/g.154077  ORF Transcript_102773/g.154077 Transcript_102773/m.154077 type:complete len:240 (+) Transcript_102773:907-1626(+)